jgi:hypothetical protein
VRFSSRKQRGRITDGAIAVGVGLFLVLVLVAPEELEERGWDQRRDEA